MTTTSKIFLNIKRSILISVVALLAAYSPLTALTAFAVDDPATCANPPASQPGSHRPNGSDGKTYSYNCDSGLWENAHYTYNPANDRTTPKDPVVYTYNDATSKWDKTVWEYDAPSGTYYPETVSVAQPPAGATTVGGPPPIAATSTPAASDGSSNINNTGAGSSNTINNDGPGGSSSIDGTGSNSTNAIGGTANNSLNLDNLNNAILTNSLNAQATTGNSIVIGNTTAGNATTGNAQDVANVVNMLQSSSSALDGNTVTFVANIDGDVNGDLFFDPSTLGAVQSTASSVPAGNNDLKINNTTNATLTNNINLAANSGDATVAENTKAGNATTGSAEAIANVVNLINSAIGSGKSFVGTININGNFNGDILIPQNFIDQLVASNVPIVTIDTTGANSTNTIDTNSNSNNTTVTNTNNQGITNNVNASANSGQATLAGNTKAGNATSGNAATHITAFNLTGSNVIGSNDLLVFVNVLGTWVGMIVSAPAGSTAAELGSGITTNNQTGNNTTDIKNTVNQKINNNITASAQSGDATVRDNTNAGNATSGSAKSAVNLLNVENSSLSLSNWFGILFINVFGTWHGSFGVNTSAGDPVAPGPFASSSSGAGDAKVPAAVQVFRFAPHAAASAGHGGSGATYAVANTGSGSTNTINATLPSSARLAASTTAQAPTPDLQTAQRNLWLPIAGVSFFVLYLLGERYYSRHQIHKA